MSATCVIENYYEETYDSVHEGLITLIQKNSCEAEKHIKGILESLYVRQGNDWTGRGALGNASLDASVAAYESILADLARLHANNKL
jgi:hypothetical protein